MNAPHSVLADFARGTGPTGLVIAGDAAARIAELGQVLEGTFACAYLDPPYNTGRARPGYGDRRRLDDWEAELERVVRAVRPLLRPDGLCFVQIDDAGQAYAQLVLDRVFGRSARRATVVVKMSELSGLKMRTADRRLPRTKEFLFVYANSDQSRFRPTRRPKLRPANYTKYYNHVIENPEDPVESWQISTIRDHLARLGRDCSRESIDAFRNAEPARCIYRTNNRFLAGLRFDTPTAAVTSPTGVGYVWWEGRQMLFLSDRLDEPVGDIWLDISTINLGREGGVAFRGSKKPESLLLRIIEISTAPGDAVLDPYGGSGTTAAVAQKSGRRWLTFERSAENLAVLRRRLDGVCAGDDRSGVSSILDWTGGGSYVVVDAVDCGGSPAHRSSP